MGKPNAEYRSWVDFTYLSTRAKLKLFGNLDLSIYVTVEFGNHVYIPYACKIEYKRYWKSNRANFRRYSWKEKCIINKKYTKYLNTKTDTSLVNQAFDYEIRQLESRNTILSLNTLDNTEERYIKIFKLSIMKLKIMLDEYSFNPILHGLLHVR